MLALPFQRYFSVVSVIWERAIGILERSGFIPTQQLVETPLKRGATQRWSEADPVTLFEAIRLATGVQWEDMDSSDVTFWNWLELRQAWFEVWSALDTLVTRIKGTGSKAIPWAYQRSRTIEEVVGLLQMAKREFPDLNVPRPHRRPEARDMVSSGRIDAAIANTLGVLRYNSGDEYGDLLSFCLKNTTSDEELLNSLDNRLLTQEANLDATNSKDLIPRQLVRAKLFICSQEETVRSFAGFLERLNLGNTLAGSSDSAFLRRLLSIAPEKSAAVLKDLQALSENR